MPTRIYPTPYEQPAVPSLQELLAKVQAQTATQVPTLAYPQQGAIDGLSSMLKPYQGEGPMGMASSPSFYQMAGYGGVSNPLDILGSGSMGGYGGPPGVGGFPSGAPPSGGAAVPYSGPADPTVAQWEAATENGRHQMSDLRRVPMNTSALVNRAEAGRPLRMGPEASRDYMMPEAAQSYRAMMRDAAQEGVPLVFGQSYRSYPEQVAIAQEKGIYGQGGLAAVPGTSNHGEGLAVDLNLGASPLQRQWLIDHGDEYGWYFPMSDEPWHLQYSGGYEGWAPDFQPSFTGGGTGGGGGTSAPAPTGSAAAPRRRRVAAPDPETAARRQRAMRAGY